MGVGAAVVFVLGILVGFALGRASSPEPDAGTAAISTTSTAESTMPAGAVEPLPDEDEFADEDLADEESETVEPEEEADTEAPPTPKQLSPANGASVSGARVWLRWSEVEDESDGKVTYAFEIQDRAGSSWGRTQVIKDLKEPKYSARVLSVKRRWRVWAVDEEGNASEKSGWRTYTKKAAAAAPAPSAEADDDTDDDAGDTVDDTDDDPGDSVEPDQSDETT